ncbi:hypothetical protein C7U57_11930 [Pseudomonas sp. R9.37]|nr:hypothetical protein C7U57_11930 [Pseudomonas sp. R9.37]
MGLPCKMALFPCGNTVNVGAGLPAMQALRCIRPTEWMPSQASQLPHLIPFQPTFRERMCPAPPQRPHRFCYPDS